MTRVGSKNHEVKGDCRTDRKTLACRINMNYLFMAAFASVLALIFALTMSDIEYLLFLWVVYPLLLISWLLARWYILRSRDSEELLERYDYWFHSYRSEWDEYRPQWFTPKSSDQRLSSADASFILFGLIVLAVLILVGIVLFFSLTR